MAERGSWSSIFTHPQTMRAWQRFVCEREEKIQAFLQFDPELQLAGGPSRAAGASDSPPVGRIESVGPSAAAAASGDGGLAGMPFAVKDNIAVRNFRLSCGYRLLRDLVSPYTATAVEKLQERGAVVVGKTNLDEFGMGSSTENSALGLTRNPWDTERVPGGSSGGSAAAVAAGMVPFALGTDTGGSVRQPASFCGVYGLKPTYGAVSRFGMVAYASSLEVMGIISGEIPLLRRVFMAIRGQDPRDHSSLAYSAREVGSDRFSVGILQLGSVPLHDYVVSAYYVIACAEASANLAGLPALSFPVSLERGLPIGMQFLAPACAEELLFSACERLAAALPVPTCPMYLEDWRD